jgi:predicted  nucleic acid-binding Zn-ribbon protein
MDEREAVNRAVADHLERLRQRLADGKSEIERLRASIEDTHEHLAGMSRWIEQTDLQLDQQRARRDTDD